MERKGKLLFRKIFKKKSGIGYEVARSKVLNYARKKNEGDLVNGIYQAESGAVFNCFWPSNN